MDRRRSSTPRPAGERRRGERRRRVSSVLQFRRETDVRLEAGQFSALVQRWAVAARSLAPVRGLPPGELVTAGAGWATPAGATRPGWADGAAAAAAAAGATAPAAGPVAAAPAATAPAAAAAAPLVEAELEPEVGVPCPECGQVLDHLWLVRHLASVHPAWRG